jgi:hypothetical protein
MFYIDFWDFHKVPFYFFLMLKKRKLAICEFFYFRDLPHIKCTLATLFSEIRRWAKEVHLELPRPAIEAHDVAPPRPSHMPWGPALGWWPLFPSVRCHPVIFLLKIIYK